MDFAQTNIRIRRHPFSYTKVRKFVAALIRNRRIFANIKDDGVYLDIGCGPNMHADFCNLDYEWRPGLDVCWDISHRLPFPDRYVGGVFTEHCLEHFSFADGLAILADIRRIMRSHAVLRVVVPDGELYLKGYAAAALPYATEDKESFSIVTPMVSINRIFRAHGHLFIWDFDTLAAALTKVGFADVARSKFGDGRDTKLLIDSSHRQIESLYVEAVA